MKRNVLVAMIAILLIGASAVSYGKAPKDKSAMSSSTKIKQIITDAVKYPDWGYKKGLHGDVQITFTVSGEGTVELKTISSKSDELKEYVKQELQKITIKDVIHQITQEYKMTLKFNLS
jgi:outer membrane biosynthesis protein TonB